MWQVAEPWSVRVAPGDPVVDELPVVGTLARRQLQDTEGVVVAYQAAFDRARRTLVVVTAGANDKLSDPSLRICGPCGVCGANRS